MGDMSLFPAEDKARKMLPIFKMLTGYFPKAMREITRVCVANNVRYNPGKDPTDINWARGKSTDQLGSAFRHMLENRVDGLVFESTTLDVASATGIDRVYVLAAAAWRLCAALELEIETVENGASQQGLPEAFISGAFTSGEVNSKNPQRDSDQAVRIGGAPLSDRGQISCAQRAEPGVNQWNPVREGYSEGRGTPKIPGNR
jgi:hypothetical protein